jgi:hypothetical protein
MKMSKAPKKRYVMFDDLFQLTLYYLPASLSSVFKDGELEFLL